MSSSGRSSVSFDLQQQDAVQQDGTQISGNNYGVQCTTNAGTITNTVTNYYTLSSEIAHVADLPGFETRKGTAENHVYDKIERARVLFQHGRWAEAKSLFSETLQPPDLAHLAEADRTLTKYNLAHAHFALAEFDAAAKHFQILTVEPGKLETETQRIATESCFWLARCFFHTGKFEDASEKLGIFVLLQTSQNPEAHEQISYGHLWLGLSFQELKDYEQANTHLQRGYELAAKSLGERDLATLACRHHLANLLYLRQRFADALEHFQALSDAEEQLHGPESGSAVHVRCMLSFSLAKLGRYTKAEPHLQSVNPWLEMRLESLHEVTFDMLRDAGLVNYWIGRVSRQNAKYQEADSALRKSVKYFGRLRERLQLAKLFDDGISQDLDRDMLASRILLAHTMYSLNQLSAAELAYKEILQGSKQGMDEDRMACLRGLGYSLQAQKKYREVISLLQDVVLPRTHLLKHYERITLTDNYDLYDCTSTLAFCLWQLCREDEARRYWQLLVDIVPVTLSWRHNRARVNLAVATFDISAFRKSRSLAHDVTIVLKPDANSTLLPGSENYNTFCRAQMVYSWSSYELDCFDEAEKCLPNVISVLEKAQSDKPGVNLARSYYYQGVILIRKRSYTDAEKILRDSITRLSGFVRLTKWNTLRLLCRFHLAYCLFQTRQVVESRRLLEEVLNSSEVDHITRQKCLTPTHFWLGKLSEIHGQVADALTHFAKCLEMIGGTLQLPCGRPLSKAMILAWQAHCFRCTEKYEEAIEAARRSISMDPEDEVNVGLCNRTIGLSLHFTMHFEQACDYLQAAVPSLEKYWGYDSKSIWSFKTTVADCLGELSRFQEALSLLLELAESELPGARVVGNYWLGRRAFNRGDLSSASKHFNAAKAVVSWSGIWDRIRLDCLHFNARLSSAKSTHFEASGRFQELATQQYISGHTQHAVDNQYFLGVSLLKERKHNAAHDAFQKILDDEKDGRLVSPATLCARFTLARGLFGKNRYKEARLHLLAIGKDSFSSLEDISLPRDQDVKHLLARCSFSLGLFEEAKENLQSCVYLFVCEKTGKTNNFYPGYWLGRTCLALKQYDEAIPYLQSAVENIPHQCPQYDYFLGKAQLGALQYKPAMATLKQICNKYKPSNLPVITRDKETLEIYLDSLHSYGIACFRAGDYAVARVALDYAFEERKIKTPNEELAIMAVNLDQARCEAKVTRSKQLPSQFAPVIAFYVERLSDGDGTIIDVELELAIVFAQNKAFDEAMVWYEKAMAHFASFQNSNEIDVLPQQTSFARMLFRTSSRYDLALTVAQSVLEEHRSGDRPVRHEHVELLGYFCQAQCQLGRFDMVACSNLEDPDWYHQIHSAGDLVWPIKISVARCAYHYMEFDVAEELYSEALASLDPSKPTPEWAKPVATLHAMLAMTLLNLERLDDARARAFEALQCDLPKGWPDCSELHEFLAIFVQKEDNNATDAMESGSTTTTATPTKQQDHQKQLNDIHNALKSTPNEDKKSQLVILQQSSAIHLPTSAKTKSRANQTRQGTATHIPTTSTQEQNSSTEIATSDYVLEEQQRERSRQSQGLSHVQQEQQLPHRPPEPSSLQSCDTTPPVVQSTTHEDPEEVNQEGEMTIADLLAAELEHERRLQEIRQKMQRHHQTQQQPARSSAAEH